MKAEILEKIVNGIIRNEFEHVSNDEVEFTSINEEFKDISKRSRELYKKISSNLKKEQQKLLNDYSDSIISEFVILQEYYFKEGLRAGLKNLKFLNEINGIEILL